jgi:hypothetical protein
MVVFGYVDGMYYNFTTLKSGIPLKGEDALQIRLSNNSEAF